ncbi:MAG TPA: SURF1 family protein [Longimicrobiales bacterium]|nr:SURF1 family protein [Longimicrobiales bacterium]
MKPLRITRAGLAGTVLAFVVAAACVRLGFWQLHRLAERRARNAAVSARMRAEPVALPGVPRDTAGLAYRAVTVAGEYDDARSVVFAAHSLMGEPGVWLLTPLRMPGGAILVNRGWVPSPDAATIRSQAPAPRGAVRVRGLLVPIPATGSVEGAAADTFRRIWYRPSAHALTRQFPYPVASLYLQALPEAGAPPWPRRLAPPELDEGPHLSYAIQWFSFATIALVGWAVLVVRRGDRESKEKNRGEPGALAG